MESVTTEISVSEGGWGSISKTGTLLDTLYHLRLLKMLLGDVRGRGHFRNQGRLLKEVTLDPSLFILLARTVSPSTPPRTGPSHCHFLWL